MECEIKLAVDAASATQIRKSPVLRDHAVTNPEEHEHVDRYFDTHDFTLWKHGFALCVRTDGEHHVQTLKGGGSALAGLHRRTELEGEVATEAPDPELFAHQLGEALPSLARKLAANKLDGGHGVQLEPVFVNRTKRTSWQLALPDGSQVECALDIGELQHGERAVQVRELELEMKDGEPARLYELARQVHESVPVRIENVSKAERGYALATADKPHAVKATAIKLGRKASMGDALAAIVRNCLEQMQANERGVLHGDVESLHQMRVGLRRLRAALDMVRAMVRLPEPMAADIEWLAGELGDARNWDVFVDSLLDGLPLPDGYLPALERVKVAAREEAERHRGRVRGAVGNARYTTLMLALGGWIAGRGWDEPGLPSEPLGQRVGKVAPRLVQHASARVRKRAQKLDLKRPESLHKVRIAAKKERYAREFFADLVGDKASRRRHDLLTGMQDELGDLNDQFVARDLLAQLRQRVPQEPALIGFIEGVLAERTVRTLPNARRRVKDKLRMRA